MAARLRQAQSDNCSYRTTRSTPKMSKRLKPTNPKRDEGGPVQRAETNDRAMAGPSALDDDGMARAR